MKTNFSVLLLKALLKNRTLTSRVIALVGLISILSGIAAPFGNQVLADESPQIDKGGVKVQVIDLKDLPVPNATITVKLIKTQAGVEVANQTPYQKITNDKGEAIIPELAPGIYYLTIEAEGYQPLNEPEVEVMAGAISTLSIQMPPKITSEDTVEVRAESDKLIEQAAAPQAQVTTQIIRTAPLLSRTFDAALPIVPNVIRDPNGKISIKGGREDQSALLVNNADSTDPATGNFALSIPLESIEQVKVFTNPYLPEYGRFTGGVTKVETKRGGEKWKAEVYDFFPEPRFRGGKLFGLANFSPRLHFEGPILKDRLYFSQGLEYDVDKKPVRGLASPDNEIIRKVGRSFSQFDYLVSPNQTLTATINFSKGVYKHIGLDFFTPQTAAPDRRPTDLTVALIDRLTLSNGSLLETIFSYKRLDTRIEGKGLDPLVLTPSVREGNYFHFDDRLTERYQLRSTNEFAPITAAGVHRVKLGADFNYTRNNSLIINQPVSVTRMDGTLAQLIEFTRPGNLRSYNFELAAFAQDQWMVSPKLSLDYGFRAEAVRATAGINISPRVSLSYSPTESGNTVFRAGVGLFYDKIPLNALTFTMSPMQTVTTYAADGTTVVDSSRFFQNVLAARPNGKPNSGVDFAAPRNVTYNLEFNRRVTQNILLKLAYLDSKTDNDLYVSPVTTEAGNQIVLNNNGRGRYRSLEATVNVKMTPARELTFSYIRSRARGELNNFGSYFGDFPDPVIRPNEYSQLVSDAPNRFLVRGSIKLPYGLTVAPIFDVHTGFPYSVRDELQNYVGQRNSDNTRFPRFASLDVAVTKEFKVMEKYTAQFTVTIFNATNHFNPRNVFANINGPEFGTFFANYRRFYRLDFGFNW